MAVGYDGNYTDFYPPYVGQGAAYQPIMSDVAPIQPVNGVGVTAVSAPGNMATIAWIIGLFVAATVLMHVASA